MAVLHQFVRVDFTRFKAFKSFSLNLRHFNILVGPNNAGKSTILAAFRILAAALRRANTRSPELVTGPLGLVRGYSVDLRSISVAEENIFFDYQESEPASVRFRLSNRNELVLYFPEQGQCFLIPESDGRPILTPTTFRSRFNCPIGFVPILGPVDQHENLFEKEAARLALFNYRAARNFRNIWHHYPERFSEFRAALQNSWPGMDIEPPEIDRSHDKPRLFMYCPEERRPREIFWSGFGFQVWCQMLTHIVQSSDVSLFLIDEPDIYLHADLQRQLLGLLRNLGPDILIATHSTDIITEAEPDDIVVVNKKRQSGRRITDPAQLERVFLALGSNINPILTQLAKTRKVLFVEGKDFQIVGRFARKLAAPTVANRSEFAVVPVEGFNPDRMRSLKRGMEATLGGSVMAAAMLDRDYRSDGERAQIAASCLTFCEDVAIHGCKEIENYLLVPAAIDRAAERRLEDRVTRTGVSGSYAASAASILQEFAASVRSHVFGQLVDSMRKFERQTNPQLSDATIYERAVEQFDKLWLERYLELMPGKEALNFLNRRLQDGPGISVTPTSIIDAMKPDEIPTEVRALVLMIEHFASKPLAG